MDQVDQSNRQRLIVALDMDTAGEALDLARQLQPYVGMFKVGMQLFYGAGPTVVQQLKDLGGRVFLDLKLHDIPNTVGRAAAALTRLGADMINVHAGGGLAMMAEAARAVRQEAERLRVTPPLLIAVTVLTSIDRQVMNQELQIGGPVLEQVVHWARLARQAGLAGVVASPLEAGAIRSACGPEFTIVTPGVRPAGADRGDQRRVLTPAQAIEQGASYLVIGRPITGAGDPVQAARLIVREMDGEA